MRKLMSKSVLIVAAHADDEALGCGGTIVRHVAEWDSVYLVLMADGVSSRTGASGADMELRRSAADRAQQILGITEAHHLGLPDNRMDSIPLLDIVQALEPFIQRIAPSVIYTHHHGDLNIDHCRTQEAVMIACRPQPGCTVKEIYGFEVLSSTEWGTPQTEPFIPNLYVDISTQLPSKMGALEAYEDEMRSKPHSRSVEHAEILARHRGYSIGVQAAEAFAVYRVIRQE
jgi:N-acetylglucosamine malate deacetylase 1